MLTDSQIRDAAGKLWSSMAVPATPLAEIRRLIDGRRAEMPAPRARRLSRPALAFAAVALAALPAVAIVSYESRSREALEMRGGWAPPPPPASFIARLQPKNVTLQQARDGVQFSLTPPVGLPSDARLAGIKLGPIGVYNRAEKTWQTGSNEVVFRYERPGGSFDVLIQRYDASDVPGRFIFDDEGPDPKGNPVLVRRENFAWRNGDQLTEITTGNAITASAIEDIARAMHGTMLQLRWPAHHAKGDLHVVM